MFLLRIFIFFLCFLSFVDFFFVFRNFVALFGVCAGVCTGLQVVIMRYLIIRSVLQIVLT